MTEEATHEGGTPMSVDDTATLLSSKWTESPDDGETEEASEEISEESSGEIESGDEPEESEEAQVEPETEELELRSIDDIANVLELDPEALNEVSIKIKVQGEESEVTLDELRRGYQREADYSRKTAEVGEQRKEIESMRNEAMAERTRYKEALEQVGWELRNRLESIDPQEMEKLRLEDPAEWSAKMEEVRQIHEAFEGRKAEYQKVKQEEQSQFNQRLQDVVQQERGRLLEKIPEWNDQDKYNAESKALTAYLKTSGFNDQEIGNTIDHRLIVMARKAEAYDKLQGKKPDVKKVIKKAPKMTKPGQGDTSPKDSKQTALKKRLKKSGSTQDLASLLLSRME